MPKPATNKGGRPRKKVKQATLDEVVGSQDGQIIEPNISKKPKNRAKKVLNEGEESMQQKVSKK